MNFKKAIILIVGLVLPIGIFLFLKIFGENKFEVPPLFQTELPAHAVDCKDITVPYRISADLLPELNPENQELILVLVGAELGTLSRIYDQFSEDPISIIKIEEDATMNNVNLASCVFLLHSPYDLVLFNREGILRGHYVSDDRDEIDRLILELKIILTN